MFLRYVYILHQLRGRNVCFLTDTYVDQSKVVFINGKLFRSNLLFQGRGIGALEKKEKRNI